MKRHLVTSALLVMTLCLLASLAAHADITYSYTADFSGRTAGSDVLPAKSTIAWSFTVPTFITSDTTITSLTTASLGAGLASCGTITDVVIGNPTSTTFPGTSAPDAETDWNTTCFGVFTGANNFFNLPLTADGSYPGFDKTGASLNATLTISGTPAVPEPASVILMAGGLLATLRRKFWRRD